MSENTSEELTMSYVTSKLEGKDVVKDWCEKVANEHVSNHAKKGIEIAQVLWVTISKWPMARWTAPNIFHSGILIEDGKYYLHLDFISVLYNKESEEFPGDEAYILLERPAVPDDVMEQLGDLKQYV